MPEVSQHGAQPSREDAGLAALLGDYDPAVVARGRRYADEGRVTGIRREGEVVRAFVRGSERYDVGLEDHGDRGLLASCTCLAFDHAGQCKHVAAFALTLQRATPLGGALPTSEERGHRRRAATTPATRAPPAAPPLVLREAYSAAVTFARLSLYARSPLAGSIERWSSLSQWWRQSHSTASPLAADALRAALEAHVSSIEADLATLRAWQPPPSPLPGTVFGEVYDALAATYVDRRDRAEIRGALPGPIDAGVHPGFAFAYDTRRARFTAEERPLPFDAPRFRLAFTLAEPARSTPRFDDGALTPYRAADAWELFALRAILLALRARDDEAVQALEREIARPRWDHVLELLAAKTPSEERREWAFCLASTYRDDELALTTFSRRSDGQRASKPAKWKKQSFEALYAEDATDLDRDVGRVAMASLVRAGEARVALGTPQGHELLRLLARHPRVAFAEAGKPDGDTGIVADVVVGEATMRLERAPNGVLSPRFIVGDRELAPEMLTSTTRPAFRGLVRGATVISAFVPPSLRPWLATAESMGESLAFPPESVTKLARATQPLVSSGVAELPREALGVELARATTPALRVEWRVDGAAVVEMLAAPCPRAPLVTPGLGPEILTFEDGGRRVFVERDLDEEVKLASEARGKIGAPLVWDFAVGRTEGLVDALALADWLDRNPLGFVIEVKIGKPPTAVAWSHATRTLQVRKRGAWLVLDGALDVKGARLTVGDVLEAARHARRYVKAGDGLFLELSKEAIDRLAPVAIAADLAGSTP